MAKDILDLKTKLRKNLRDLLVLLSDKEKQFEYARTVGDRVAIDELLCMWFDDQYHGDKKEFREMYEEEELKSLKAFNDFYDSISEKIPRDSMSEINKIPEWKKLRTLTEGSLKNLKKP